MSQLSLEELRKLATIVGICTEGKSAEEVNLLLKEAAKQPPAPSPNVIDPKALSKHFEEGRFTDCTIRVKIREAVGDIPSGRPAKRPRSARSKATATEGPADEAEGVRVIKAHAVILSSRSQYFDRAMGGEWRESQDRSFEVEVADEQEYVTFRRLIKLCYGITFIKEGNRDLDFSELVRLIHVANAFECMDAVKECAVALTTGELDWEGALQCLELTEMLEDVEGMEDLGEKAGGVIAKEVGPVDELFVPSDKETSDEEEEEPDVLGGLKLSDKVKDLSPAAFEALISSEDLQLKTANEAFWLLLAWAEAQSKESEEGKQALFTRMAKHLSFAAMDPGYILLMVSEHPRIIAAGLQYKATRASFIHANLARRTSGQVDWLYDSVTGFPVPKDGVPPREGDKATWTFDVKFTAEDVASLGSDEGCRKVVGLVAGLPWFVELENVARNGEQKAGVHTMCDLPFKWMTYDDGAGFYFGYTVEFGVGTPRVATDSTVNGRIWTEMCCWGDWFAPWEEVFREGSEWLVNGELHVKLTVTTVNDQGPSLSTDAIASLEAESAEEESEDEEAEA